MCWMEDDEDVSTSQYLAGNGEVIAICCFVGDEALATFAPQPEVTNLDLPNGAITHSDDGEPPRVQACVSDGR